MRTLLAVVAIVLAPSIAVACPPEPAPSLALRATTSGTTLHLTFTNASDQPIDMPIRVRAGQLHYDWLTIEVFEPMFALPDEDNDDRTVLRTLTFVEDRTKAVMQSVRIAPGGSHLETIDLSYWLAKQIPLWSGPYELRIRWQYAPAWADSWVDTLYTEAALYLDREPQPLQVCGYALARQQQALDRARAARRTPVIAALGLLLLAAAVLVRRAGNAPGTAGRSVPD